jgi:hypothetical protein
VAPGGTAHAIFVSILNQLLFAEQHRLKPWIHLRPEHSPILFDDIFHNTTSTAAFEMVHGMAVSVAQADKKNPQSIYPRKPAIRDTLKTKEFVMEGHGIWDSYFEPVSDFVPGDKSCRDKPLIEMEEVLVRGLDVYAPWSVRAWQYDQVLEKLWNPSRLPLSDWYAPMRRKASEIVNKYFRFQPYLVRRA